jgi:transposase
MAIVAPLLAVLRTMPGQLAILTRRVQAIVRQEATCHCLMTVPGVGLITALPFRTTVDDPGLFAKSRVRIAVARKLGVTLHHMWRDGADFRFGAAPITAAA